MGKRTNHFGGQSVIENNSVCVCVCLEWSGGVSQSWCSGVQVIASTAYREAGRSS